MAENQAMAQEIGQAWGQHRAGRNDEAISSFEQVLTNVPDSIDALYGLGLAQRATGNSDGAVESFQKALQLAKDGFESLQKEKNENKETGGVVTLADLATPEEDRFMMLERMIAQRLAELGVISEEDVPTII